MDAPKLQIINGVSASLLLRQLVQREAVGLDSPVSQIFSQVDPKIYTAIGISLATLFGQSQAKAQSWSQPARTNANNAIAYRYSSSRVDLVVAVQSKQQFELIKLLIPKARPIVLNGESFALIETYQDVELARSKATQLDGSVPWNLELLIYSGQIPAVPQNYSEVNAKLTRGFKLAAKATKASETAATLQRKPSLKPAPVSPTGTTTTLTSTSTQLGASVQPSNNLPAIPKPVAPSATLVASAAALAATTTPTESAAIKTLIGDQATGLANNSAGTTSQPTTYSSAANSYQPALQSPGNWLDGSSIDQPITAAKSLAKSMPVAAPKQMVSDPILKPSKRLPSGNITAPQQLSQKSTIIPPIPPSSKQVDQAGSVGAAENPVTVAIRAPISSESIKTLAVNPDLDYIFVSITSDADVTKLASMGQDVTASPIRLSGGARVVQVGTFLRSRIGRQLKDEALSSLKAVGFSPTVVVAQHSS